MTDHILRLEKLIFAGLIQRNNHVYTETRRILLEKIQEVCDYRNPDVPHYDHRNWVGPDYPQLIRACKPLCYDQQR